MGFFSRVWRSIVRYLWGDDSQAQDFQTQFERAYGPNHPDFYNGTHTEAFTHAYNESKLVLVYLHSDYHSRADEFCKSILQNDEVIRHVNENFVFWAESIHRPLGYFMCQELRVTAFPLIAVLSPGNQRQSVLALITGFSTPDLFVAQLGNVAQTHAREEAISLFERQSHSTDQQIREEQDRAYHESLRADEERARFREEEEERVAMEAALAESRKEAAERKIQAKREALMAEPATDDPNAVCLAIRLPGGERVHRRFPRGATLQTVFDFLESRKLDMARHRLMSAFPRNSFAASEETLEQAGLFPKPPVLFVEERFDLDEEPPDTPRP